MKSLSLLFVFLINSIAWAGEDRIVGDNRKGVHFEFYRYFNDSPGQEASETGAQGQKLRLVVSKYVPYKKNSVTLQTVGEYSPVACYLVERESSQVFQCDVSAPQSLAGSQYVKAQKGRFRCVKNCSEKIPSKLTVEEVPNGC